MHYALSDDTRNLLARAHALQSRARFDPDLSPWPPMGRRGVHRRPRGALRAPAGTSTPVQQPQEPLEPAMQTPDPTFRRHPRTAAEAFPRTTEYACALTRPEPAWRPADRLEWVAVACVAALACLAAVMLTWG